MSHLIAGYIVLKIYLKFTIQFVYISIESNKFQLRVLSMGFNDIETIFCHSRFCSKEKNVIMSLYSLVYLV